MTSLARYHSRSPRFTLNTEDDSLIRVAGPQQIPWEEGTQIKNVSLTGISFTAADDLCPLLGEVIKIQFTPPGARQLACHGIVTRLENIAGEQTLVGVHFYKMDMNHRISLAQGLARKFKEHQDRGEIDDLLNRTTKSNLRLSLFPQFFMLMVLAGVWSFSLYMLFHFQYHGLMSLLFPNL